MIPATVYCFAAADPKTFRFCICQTCSCFQYRNIFLPRCAAVPIAARCLTVMCTIPTNSFCFISQKSGEFDLFLSTCCCFVSVRAVSKSFFLCKTVTVQHTVYKWLALKFSSISHLIIQFDNYRL